MFLFAPASVVIAVSVRKPNLHPGGAGGGASPKGTAGLEHRDSSLARLVSHSWRPVPLSSILAPRPPALSHRLWLGSEGGGVPYTETAGVPLPSHESYVASLLMHLFQPITGPV